MNTRTNKIREIAKKLLDKNKVDVVIGFKKGTIPLRNIPYFATNSKEADQLVWDGNCVGNLAIYLPRTAAKRTAIIAQGCVSRNVVGLIQEKQVNGENIYIIGMPCSGMLDARKIMAAVPGEITEAIEDDLYVTARGKGFELTMNRSDVLNRNCDRCSVRNPVLFDELAVEKVNELKDPVRYEKIRAVEAMSTEERAKFIDELLSPCIRCYACRDACPLCYCPECFVDKANPQWCGKSQDSMDVLSYHLIRAFHTAGRCTECGACEEVCPMGIKVRLISGKVEKDVRETFDDYAAWKDLKALPPLTVFQRDDPQPFVKE
ncbi:MAG: 4Fe-4S dicluster domain-containing protein [Dissulfurispiraceae bacterium]|jgi:formate dehydrogenase (coenzyme F420) beta subunit